MSSKNKKFSVAMIGHKRIPSREGGVEIVVEQLSKRMVKRGIDVTCYNRLGHHVSGKEFDSNSNLKELEGVKIKKVFTIDKGGLSAMTSSFFASIRASFSPAKVVHFHAEGPCAMMFFPRLFGKRCIATIHGLDHKRAKWGKFASRYIKFGEKCAAKLAHEIIVLSNDVKEYFLENYGRETVFIPNGVTRPKIRNARLITQKFGIEKNEYILFLGRIVPEKGVAYLIDAFKKINTDKKLVIAGGVSDTDEFLFELKAKAQGDNRIIFTDFVEGELLDELYSNAYIYVLPSDLEGMPISLLEAMSFGNCCLTSDITECTQVLGDCGVTFKKGDSNDLKEKIEYLLKDKKTVENFKKNSANYVLEKYNWDDIVEKTLSLYKIPKNIKPTREEHNENFACK